MFQAIEQNGEATLSTAWNAARPHAARIATKLEKKGLLANSASRFLARWIPMAILGSVFVLGACKVWVGVMRGKPVGFLIVLSCVTFFALILFAVRPWRNQQGNRELRKLMKQHRKIKKSGNLPSSESKLLMQWSLYGMSAMLITGGAVTTLHNWIQPAQSSSSGGCGSAGCGGGRRWRRRRMWCRLRWVRRLNSLGEKVKFFGTKNTVFIFGSLGIFGLFHFVSFRIRWRCCRCRRRTG